MKLSVQTGGLVDRLGFEQGYALLKEAGFEAIDWSIGELLPCSAIYSGQFRGTIMEKPVEEILQYLEPERMEIQKNGLKITQAHAPFPAYIPTRPEIYHYIPMVYEKYIRICAAVGCQNLVIHGINHLINDDSKTPEQIDEMNYAMYAGMIPLLKETNVIVCLENLFTGRMDVRGANYLEGHCADPVKAAQLIDALNAEAGKECFGLCLDTGHLHLVSVDPRVYIPALGKRIKALHVHDNNGLFDQHYTPYTGNVPWKQYCASLRDIGYAGDLSFEIRYIEEKELFPAHLQALSAIGTLFRRRIIGE